MAGKAELRLNGAESIVVGVTHLLRHLGALDQCLARYTAVVEAVTSHFVRFHQGNFRFHCRRDVGGHQAAGACPNHYQVAVEARRPLPAPVYAAALYGAHQQLGDPGEEAE